MTIKIPEVGAPGNASGVVTMQDGSMIPRIEPGDKVFIDLLADPAPGDIVLVRISGEAYLRYYYPIGDGAQFLASNPDYQTGAEIRSDYEIIGRACGLNRKIE